MRNILINYNYFLLIGCLLSLPWTLMSNLGSYPIISYSPDDYKAGIQNIDFAQNRNQDIFVANNLGVLSFNGIEWESHDYKSGKKKRSLAFDEKLNRLYVGSQGEFGYFEKDWTYTSLNDLIPDAQSNFDEVWDVYITGSGVYFCTFQSIFLFDGHSINTIQTKDGFNRSFQVNDDIFTQSPEGEIFHIKNGQLSPPPFPRPDNQILSGIISHDEGYLLFYNSGDIIYGSPFEKEEKYAELQSVLKSTYVNHVLQLSDTRIAISTQTAGLFLFNPQTGDIEQITTEDGLHTNACLRSFQDFSGNLWLGLQNGIALIDIKAPIRFINRDANLQGSGYEVHETASGTYFTTTNGIYFLPKNSTQSLFINGTEGPSYCLREIDGHLYAGHHTGLFLLKNEQAIRIANINGIWDIQQLNYKPGYAIAGTYAGLYAFQKNKENILEALHPIDGFNESSRFFIEDTEGKIIVSQYYKGLYRLELDNELSKVKTYKYSNNQDIPIGNQIILGEIDNELYLGTNNGLHLFDPVSNTIEVNPQFSSVIGNQPVYLFKQDSKKNIHIITENLVGYFKPQSINNYVFVPSSVYQRRYFFNNDLLQISEFSDGIMFSANEGFIFYQPEEEERMGIPLPICIKRIYSVNEDKILYQKNTFESIKLPGTKLELASQSKILQFKVETFQYNNGQNLKFRYKLDGLEEDYGPWTNAATKEYTNLVHGDYSFHVQTTDQLGEIITSDPLSFSVSPPFYKSFVARLLYLLLGLSLIIILTKFQKKKYNRKAEELREESKLRLAEKQQRILQIEQQKEQELHRLEEEKMKSELRQINNQLAASTMNLVAKNEFIKTIKNELQEIEKMGINQPTQKAIQKIEKEIDLNLRLQEDWEQFEFHFDKVHGDFMQRLRSEYKNLTPNDQKLCTFLRLNLSTKEITNLMGISQRGIEIARYRLRKKLNLEKGQNLTKFILEY